MQEQGESMSTGTQPQQLITGRRRLIVWMVCLSLLFFVMCLGMFFLVQIPYVLAVGWAGYLWRTGPTLTLSAAGTLWFSCTLALFFGGVHLAGRRVYRGNERGAGMNWRLRWSFFLVALVLMLATSGICLIGMSHQLWWMATRDRDKLVKKSPGSYFCPVSFREAARRSTSKNNLKQIGLALHNYHDEFRQFPIGATVDSTGKPQHGWVARVLPYLDHRDLYQQIDFHQPWTADVNRKPFENPLPALRNPGLNYDFEPGEKQQAERSGYQPAHYAANQRLLGVNGGLRIQDIKDGTSQTILGGEVKEGIRPWGDPLNFRDPAQGINQGPQGFGGPFGPGAHVLFADGSIRFLSDDIDPAVLKALSTPNGRERVEEVERNSGK